MKMRLTAFFVTAMITSTVALGARQESLLKESWHFCRGEVTSASQWE